MRKAVDTEESPGPTYPITSVDNALRLLRLVGEREQLRLSDASSYLGVAHSTAHRLLAMLVHHDFIRQDPVTKIYVAGPALLDVGLAAVHKMDIRGRARPVLERLAAQLNETVHLAVRENTRVRYLDAIESTKMLRVASRTGAVLPAHCTSVGKVLLADLSPAQLDELYPKDVPIPAQTHRSLTTRAELDAQLATTRRHGYAVNREESEDGVSSVAVAVRNGDGSAVAAISVATPANRMTTARRREIAQTLFDAVTGLSE